MEQYIADALENMENEEQAFYDITDKAADKNYEVGYENLTEGEKKLFGVGKLIAEVNNGGFDQYFFNTNGEYAEDTLEFLNKFGSVFFSNIIKESNVY